MKPTGKESYTADQIAALVSILVLATWMSAVFWLHLTHPDGAHHLEFVFLGALTPVLWILSALYALRVRWSYLGGILTILIFFAGVFKAISDNTLFFSVSFYNLLTILILAVSVAGIWFSFRAFRQVPAQPSWHTIAGLGGTILLMGLLAWLVISNENFLQRINAQFVLGRLEAELAGKGTLEEKISYLVKEGGIPSLSLAMVVDDELVWSGAYGQDPAPQTRYNAGSLAKPVIATAVLQLSERGLLDLDADINDYLPFTVRSPQFPEPPITPRMLLTHRSGLAHFTPTYFTYEKSVELLQWENDKRGSTIYGPVEPLPEKPDYASFMAGYLHPDGAYYTSAAWTSSKPGTNYHYSSPGYDLLAYLVEAVSGQPLLLYLQENIFVPLEMEESGLLAADADEAVAPPYERVSSVLMHTNVRLPRYGNERLGGGGLATTAPDLARFLIAHLNHGRYADQQILTPRSIALMHSPAMTTTADIGMRASGYGWSIRQEEPWQYWGTEYPMRGAQGHGGKDYGYRASMYFVEEEEGGYGFVILTNTADLLKQDMLWFFAIYLQLEKLLMNEAEIIWAAKHKP